MIKTDKISAVWISLWVISNLVVGLFSLFVGGYFLMVLLAAFLFPLTQTLLLMLRYDKDQNPGYWLLSYLTVFIIAAIYNFVSPIITLLTFVFISEIVLMLITNKFGRFVFSAITILGMGLLYVFSESLFFKNSDVRLQFIFILSISSLVTGFAMEAHKWNISKMKNINS